MPVSISNHCLLCGNRFVVGEALPVGGSMLNYEGIFNNTHRHTRGACMCVKVGCGEGGNAALWMLEKCSVAEPHP